MTVFHENYNKLRALTTTLQQILCWYKFFSRVPWENRFKKVITFEKSKILVFAHFCVVFVMILIYCIITIVKF
jgi:hypothetical protein